MLEYVKNNEEYEIDEEDIKIKKEIQAIMDKFAQPYAKSTRVLNKYEDEFKYSDDL